MRRDCSDAVSGKPHSTFDCTLYGHAKVLPAAGVPGNCFKLSDTPFQQERQEEEEEEEDVEVRRAATIFVMSSVMQVEVAGPVHMGLLGRGRCRGSGWAARRWPLLRGRLPPRQCAHACAARKGCTAFDLSEPREVTYCSNFSHT